MRSSARCVSTDAEVAEITQRVLRESPPRKGSVFDFLYSERWTRQSEQFAAQPQFRGEPRTMIDSINQTLAEEMRRDSRIVVFGEDVADCSREAIPFGSERERRRVQGDGRFAARIWQQPVLQHAD